MSDANLEKDLNATGDVFKILLGSMKSSFPVWEDFLQRGQRFQRTLEQLIVAFNSFLDGFSRLADAASHSKGGTQDMGASLTNLVRWHKAVELKIREINYSFSTKLLTPVGNRLDEWKKSLSNLEKDHDKEMSRSVKDTKEVLKSTIKAAKTLESKRKKDKNIGPLQQQFEQMQADTDQKIADTELKEKVHMSRLMVEERVWFASLSNAFKSVLDNELTLATDLERLPDLVTELQDASSSPSILPESIRDYIENWQIPPVARGRQSSLASQSSILNMHASSTNSLESPQTAEMNISHPVPTLGPQVSSSYSQLPPVQPTTTPPAPPNYPPPPEQQPTNSYQPPPPPPHHPHSSHRRLPEELYDVPVPTAYVSVSPSQVSLVSNSSHHSADSTHSSTRSASPPYSHLAPAHQQTPIEQSHAYQPHPQAYFSPMHHQNASALQHDAYNKTRPSIETDLERPNQFQRANTVESIRYIPATLPRPRKPNASPPVQPKPIRNSGNYAHMTTQATPPGPSPPDEDEGNMSAFAQALRRKQLKRTETVSDRSAPKVH